MKYHFLIKVKYQFQNTASSKPLSDCTEIFKQNGFEDLSVDYSRGSASRLKRLTAVFSLFSRLLALWSRMRPGDLLAIQYPVTGSVSKYLLNDYLAEFLNAIRKRKVECIGLIHDIEVLRKPAYDQGMVANEIAKLNSFTQLIVHNDKMGNWLKANGLIVPTVSLSAFDYLTSYKPVSIQKEQYNKVVFAGNLIKSEFIYSLSQIPSWQFQLYGPNYNKDIKQPNVQWGGEFTPEEVVSKMDGDFGLIWDGIHLEKLDQQFGSYLKYNNPHKFSLYLAAGLPVIAPRESAIASFITTHRVGILIDSLRDLENISISPDQYAVLRQNTLEIAGKVTSGAFLSAAAAQIARDIHYENPV